VAGYIGEELRGGDGSLIKPEPWYIYDGFIIRELLRGANFLIYKIQEGFQLGNPWAGPASRPGPSTGVCVRIAIIRELLAGAGFGPKPVAKYMDEDMYY